MTKSLPKNHHFVPQHFLKAWQSSEGRIFRYRFISNVGKFESKEVGIRKTASINNLYKVQFPDGSFEIESSVVSREIDDAGHKIIEKARSTSLSTWSDSEKRSLANYLTCLEARHPEVIEAMNIGPELEALRKKLKKDCFSSVKSIDEVFDYFQSSPSIGVIAFAWFLQNEKSALIAKPFSDGLLSANVREYNFNEDVLICSSYPVSRWGDYLDELFFAIAISPTKAIVYSTSPDIDVIGVFPEKIRSDLINLYSLSKADTAYFKDNSKSEFIERHIGWATKLKSVKAQKEYIGCFLKCELLKAGAK